MRNARATVACLLAISGYAQPVSAETIFPAAISAAETATIDGITKRTFEQIRNGKATEGLDQFFGTGQLIKGKSSEMSYLASQIDSVAGIYGPMGECRLSEERIKVGLVVQRLYLCRHGQFMTRWKLLFVNTTGGWTGANIFFDDKVSIGLDE